jgi:diguanylate cyclase (GGDEF)-like protein
MVANILKRIIGDKGTICRYGGEEFTVILPYHDARKAYELAEKIRTEIEASLFQCE